MADNMIKKTLLHIGIASAILLFSGNCLAQVFEDVTVEQQQGSTARITIKFTANVRYKRFVVSSTNDLASIYFEVAGLANDGKSVFEESRKWTDASVVPAFTARYFSQATQPAEKRLDLTFEAPLGSLKIVPSADEQSLVIEVTSTRSLQANPAPAPRQAATLPPMTLLPNDPSPSDREQSSLIDLTRGSIARQDYETAIAYLNRVLNMPPGTYSQEAQELIGIVREQLGETKRAQAEYELYLKLYPDSPDAARVKARIASLSAIEPAQTQTASSSPAKRKPLTTSWGGLSQYYYGGQSRIRDEFTITTPATGATEIDTRNISSVDQSSVVTDVNYNLRHRSGNWDSRFTFRDTFRSSFLDSQPSRNRLSAAYIDLKNDQATFETRLGRQTAASGGVLGRFDGAVVNYGFGSSRVRAGVELGQLSEPGLGGDKQFFGVTLDADKVFNNFGLEFFAIQQNAGSQVDRRAVGGEVRYFDAKRSFFSLIDYDVMFRELNIASAQGNFGFGEKLSVNFLYDYRRSPSLQRSNALLGLLGVSLSDLARTQTSDEIKTLALGLTPVSRVSSLGVTYAFTPKWQFGADYRVSSVDGTIATPTLPASPATGNVKTVSTQLIGTSVFVPSGVLVLNSSYLTSPSYNAWLFGISTRFKAGNWALEPGFKYYAQDNAIGSNSRRFSPVGRFAYQFREKLSFEGEVNFEKTRTESQTSNEDLLSLFYYLGYRYDF
jgi:tetratricopeptide (TPR) repeat protein